MKILDLFRRAPVAVSSPDVLADYDDVLESYRRTQDKNEARIIAMREKIVDLEGVEERVSASIVEMKRECDQRLYDSQLQSTRSEKLAKLNAEDAVTEAKRAVTEELREAKESLAEVKSSHTIAQREIEQMVTMDAERSKLELDKKIVELEKVQHAAIQSVRDEYHEKLEAIQTKQIDDGDKRFEAILARLPNTKVKLEGRLTNGE
jgi:hypothetical protein